MIRRIFRRERKLGISKKRTYDIPLNKGAGAGFLTLLIALMTFLAVIALSSSFVLKSMSDRWSSGLENKITVEIPPTSHDGETRNKNEISQIAERIESLLQNHPAIDSVTILDNDEISELISPWLGENFSLEDIPVPGLLSVELNETSASPVDKLADRIEAIDKSSRLDTHESWLNDLLNFAGALQLGAFILAIIIGSTTVAAVAGAVRARMAVHSAEIELLHIMGASDEYITRQFQRHSLILALKGGLAGTVSAMLGMMIVAHLAGDMHIALIPEFRLSTWQLIFLLSMPFFAGLVAMTTARFTVLKALSRLP